MEAKIKHLEIIQGVINRMASNSFLLKGWSVTLISALAVLAQKDTNAHFWMVALVPSLVFWGLDGYFLRQEKLFRKLYESVSVKNEEQIDFSMKTTDFEKKADSWLKVTFSKTLIAFYGAMLVAVSLIAWFVIHAPQAKT